MGLLESIITRRVGFPAKFICGVFGDEASSKRGYPNEFWVACESPEVNQLISCWAGVVGWV
jgi:hypothetical protein